MPTEAETLSDDLAGNDQAGSLGQPELEQWKQKYAGANGKLLSTQTQLAEVKSGLLEERARWDAERKSMTDQLAQMQAAQEAATAQLTDLMGKWDGLSAQSETLAAQVARQRVMLEHPHLISDPVLKLVESSTLTASDLAETLSAMAQGQQQLVKQVYQDVQTGATPRVDPATALGASAKKEQAQASWNAALDAMSKGDMATYRAEYSKYLNYTDESGGSKLAAPVVLASRKI